MSQATCETCAAFSALTKECRREPPRPFMVNNGGRIEVLGGWPGTQPNNWCCQHIPIKVEIPT